MASQGISVTEKKSHIKELPEVLNLFLNKRETTSERMYTCDKECTDEKEIIDKKTQKVLDNFATFM